MATETKMTATFPLLLAAATLLIGAVLQTADVRAGQTLRLAETGTPLEIPESPATAAPAGQSAVPAEGEPMLDPSGDDGDTPDGEDISLGEIPTIETMELTPDIAKRALDSYIAAKNAYGESDLEQYENLQDFVDQTEDGKRFEADVKAAGFANVSDWNLAITTLGLTYASVIDDQTADLKQQIEEVEGDDQLAQDMKDKMVKALQALIPSENNRKVIEELMADPAYDEKLKKLDIEEE